MLQRSEMFEGWASVILKFNVIDLVKITSRKSVKNSVILHVKEKNDSADEVDDYTVSEYFFTVKEKKECVKTIRDEFYKATNG